MRFEDFTKGQQQAIISDGTNIIVSAGAGSGKTAVLTERVLYFIKNKGYNINDFIILTFTDLAAGEMKERIRKALTNEGLVDTNNVDTAQISTFDSFALALVKKYHQYLNVSKDISIIDSSIISVKKKNIIHEIFEEYYGSNNEVFSDMIKQYCHKEDDDIVNLVYELVEKSTLEIDSDQYLNTFIERYFNNSFYKENKVKVLQSLFFKLDDFFNKLKEFKRKYDYAISNKDERIYSEVLYDLFSSTQNLIYDKEENINIVTFDNVDEWYDKLFLEFIKELPSITSSNFGDSTYSKAKDDIKKTINKMIDIIKSYPQNGPQLEQYFKATKAYAALMIDIVKEVFNRLNKYKEEKQVYEFQDIAKMALRLVKESVEVRESIKKSTKMIMIDEYQDTSLLQDTFIGYIANKNVYMVGDIKQSIYRFRNARSDLFLAKYNKYKKNDDGIAIDLNTNFRSRKEVLEDINYLFSSIMSEEMGGANYLKDHMIESGNKNYDLAGDTSTSHNSDILICASSKDDSDIVSSSPACLEAKAVALDIIDKIKNHYQVLDTSSKTPKLRDCTYSDFCILADRGTEFDKFVEIFNEYQVPLFVENDENISNSEIVSVLTNLLKLVKIIQNNDYLSDELIHSFISVARSFIYQYSDEKLLEISINNDKENTAYLNNPIMIKLKEIVENNPNAPVADLFSKIVFELDLYNALIRIGEISKHERYLDLFIENFKSMSKLGYNIDDFLLYLKNINEYNLKFTLTSSKSSIDSVKIMNIHKSKGLEFPIVYFVRLDKGFNRMDVSKNYGISKEYGIYFYPGENKVNILKDLNEIYETKEDDSEKIRLFYVALTRTKEKMIFVVNDDENYTHLLKKSSDLILKSIDTSNNIKDIYQNLLSKYISKEINYNIFEHCLSSLGYHLTYLFEKEDREKRCLIKPVDAIFELKFEEIKEKINKLNNDYAKIWTLLNKLYMSKEIDFVMLKTLVEDLGYAISPEFKNNTNDLANSIVAYQETEDTKPYKKNNNISSEDTDQEAINDDNSLKFKNFKQLFNVVSNNLYTYRISDDLKDEAIIKDYSTKEKKSFTTKEIKIESNIIERKRASKQIDLNVDLGALEFGNKVHFMMEIMDFANPDYSILQSPFEKSIIKRFLDSDLMKNVKEGKIYKEYEFYDEKSNITGIIDLMVVYSDYIDIIDYKTKNIDDEAYNEQLKVYSDYIRRKFNKKINAYLYSLLTGSHSLVIKD